MKLRCENCSTTHDLDPPSWVVSSGRPFRFRCSSCGYSQSVHPDRLAAEPGDAAAESPAEVPDAAPPEPPVSAEPTTETPPAKAVEDSDLFDEVIPPSKGTAPRRIDTRPPHGVPLPKITRQATPVGPGDRVASWRKAAPTVRALTPPPAPVAEVTPSEATAQSRLGTPEGGLWLKQSGQVFRVRDYDTLRRWISEGRVEPTDLVSEGGVRYDAVGDRPDLAAPPAADAPLPPPQTRLPVPTPGPVSRLAVPPAPSIGGEMPFGPTPTVERVNLGWHDDDTEGIPTGLPPLPTEEVASPTVASPPPDPEIAPPLILTATPAPQQKRSPSSIIEPSAVVAGPPEDEAEDAEEEAPGAHAVLAEHEDDPDDEEPKTAHGALPRMTPRPIALLLPGNNGPLVRSPPPERAPARPPVPISLAPPPIAAPAPSRPAAPPPAPETETEGPGTPTAIRRMNLAEFPTSPPATRDTDLESWLDDPPARGVPPWAWGALAGLTTLAGLAIGIWAFSGGKSSPGPDANLPRGSVIAPAPAPPPPAPPAPVLVPAPPAPEALALEPESPVPPPAPIATPKPAPPPPPAPPEPEPAPRGPSLEDLVNQGWSSVEASPSTAKAAFKRALDISPTNAAAAYGYGYLLLREGDRVGANPWLCTALTDRDVDTRREVQSLLEHNTLSCP